MWLFSGSAEKRGSQAKCTSELHYLVLWALKGIHQLDIDTDKGKAEIPRGRSVNKLATDPLRIIHGAVEETTGWVYGSLSLLSDLIFEDEEESEKGQPKIHQWYSVEDVFERCIT
uniref:Uncharacterized protein n=1 Tax=Sphaerodactylus townsendi TaxID=933632 RepID=A0ACB8GCE4_9SAUR